jgi:hypothetical protein
VSDSDLSGCELPGNYDWLFARVLALVTGDVLLSPSGPGLALEEQWVIAAVCEATDLGREEWGRLTERQRVPWLQRTLLKLWQKHTSAPTENAEQAATVPPARLTVYLPGLTVTLDGWTYEVESEQALRWVKVLADHAGEWISGPKLKEYDQELDGARTNRLKRFLPPEILSLISTDQSKGSRLRLA